MINCIFYHGGPGFNSNAERNILGKFQDENLTISFWNEPCEYRSEGDQFVAEFAWENAVKSALKFYEKSRCENKKNILIFHSFSLEIFKRIKGDIDVDGIVLISPAFDLMNFDRNIIQQTINDFKDSNPEVIKDLKNFLRLNERLFDTPMQQAITLASVNEKLFTHYWHDPVIMKEYFEYNSSEAYSFDFNSFASIRTQLQTQDRVTYPNIPFLIVNGAEDIFNPVNFILEKMKEENLEKAKVFNLEKAGHFPHIEQKEQFIDLILKEFS